MSEHKVEMAFPAAPEKVWALVGDFGAVGDWLPGIDSCVLEGDDRVLSMLGMEVRERLVERDEAARRLVYSIIGGAPIDSHRATITVEPDGAGSTVVWVFEVVPDEMGPVLAEMYGQALGAAKERIA